MTEPKTLIDAVKDWTYEQRQLAVEFATMQHMPIGPVYDLLNTFGRCADHTRLTRAVIALLECECPRLRDFENYDAYIDAVDGRGRVMQWVRGSGIGVQKSISSKPM